MSARLIDVLAGAGHDVLHLADLGLLGSTDRNVMDAARTDGRVLVSADTDFGELLARSGALLPSVVLLRQKSHHPHRQGAVLLGNLDQVADDLSAGAIVVITEDRVRVRRLPLR